MRPTTCTRKAVHVAGRAGGRQLLAGLALLLASGLGLFGARAGAQGPAPAPPPGAQLPPKSYMNKSVFYLPILIDDRVRSNLREIQLFAKDHPSKQWLMAKKALPTDTVFPYRPMGDGEFWFTVVTVDKSGRQTPADVSHEGPGVIVVYDTQAPLVDIRQLQMASEGQLVQCEARDPNLDPTKTRMEYQTADKAWRAGEPVPGRADTFCIPQQAMHNGMVKVTAVDMAGNVTVREMSLIGRVAGMNVSEGPTQVAVSEPAAPRQLPVVHNTPPVVEGPALGGLPGNNAPPSAPARVESVTQAYKITPPSTPCPGGVCTPQANAQEGKVVQTGATVPASSRSATAPAARHLVSSTHVSLEYQIEQVGASGVGKVEMWITSDGGQTWQCLGEDPDRHSPVEIDLPGEGSYGVSLVVSNGRGFGATPPAPGDAPDWWIEVDLTKPVVELTSVRPGSGDDATALWINWNARDKNLGNDAVDLFYAVNREGPWTPIARGVKNDSRYRWSVPKQIGPLAFIRLVVTDKAGNKTQCETPQAIALDDMSRPRGHVVGIAPTADPQAGNPASH